MIASSRKWIQEKPANPEPPSAKAGFRGITRFARLGLPPHNQIGELMQPHRTRPKGLEHLVSTLTFLLRHPPGSVQTIHRRKRDLMLLCVFTRSLSEHFRRLLHVQNVVDNLERQPDVLAVARNGGVLLVRRAGKDGAQAQAGSQERTSLRLGAIFAGATDEQYAAISCYGEHIGLAFQIVDDILDVEESSEVRGKNAGKDAQQQQITFPAVYGLDTSRRMAEQECERAHQVLEPFGARAVRLHELADLIVRRKS